MWTRRHGRILLLLGCALACAPRGRAGTLLISEFLASNQGGLEDEDGQSPDWIEICNAGTQTVDLAGCHLTDERDYPTKWTFPAATLAPGEHLVVFASEKDRRVAGRELHTNFRLDAGGEYLALVAPDGINVLHAFSPAYLPQFPNVSFGLGSTGVVSTLLSSNAAVRARIPADGSLGDAWMQVGFDDAAWLGGTSGAGYETETGYEGEIGLDLEAAMRGVNATAYLRFPFVAAGPAPVDRLRLNVRYDDGFAAYLNGAEVARRNLSAAALESDRVVSYSATTDAGGGVVELTGVTVSRGGHMEVYGVADLVGIELIHFKGNVSSSNITTPAGAPPPPAGARHTLLDGDRLLQTGVVNPGYASAPPASDPVIDPANPANSTPGMAVRFLSAVTNGPGDDVVFMEYQTAPYPPAGDAFHVAPLHGIGTQGLTGITVSAHDIQYPDALPLANFQLHQFASARQSLADLEAGALTPRSEHSGFRLLAVGIDLTDLGYAEGAAVTGLFFQAADSSNVVDPVFIAGLPHPGPGLPAWQAAALGDRPDGEALQFEPIDITAFRAELATGTNVLAVHGANVAAGDADFLVQPVLEAVQLVPDPGAARYFTGPTPGAMNPEGRADPGPSVGDPGHVPAVPGTGMPLTVTARVAATLRPVADVTLTSRVMFGPETAVGMVDDGSGGDEAAGDGLYTATLVLTNGAPGDMVRWYVTARDDRGQLTRYPPFPDPLGSAEYLGTVVADPSVASALPVLCRFVKTTSAADTDTGTRCSVFYGGEFYDNVFIRIRGRSTRNYPKKSYKLDFNPGDHFRFKPDLPRVEEINLNTTYTDQSYMRQVLGAEAWRDAGSPYSESLLVHMRQNGAFFGVATMVEQVDADYLERNGLGKRGALYKMENAYTSAYSGVNKRSRLHEDNSDLQALIDGLKLTGAASETFLFDHVNLPGQISYLAGMISFQHVVGTLFNYYAYRDTEGTGEWQELPWDWDRTFGLGRSLTELYADLDTGDAFSHPFGGGFEVPALQRTGPMRGRIFQNARTRQMFLRRLRTLMDEALQPPGTPPGQCYFETRIGGLKAAAAPDVALDKARWGADAHYGGTEYTLDQAIERITNLYLRVRRTHLYQTHSVTNTAYALCAGIPGPQPSNVVVAIGALDVSPASGNQDEEYVELVNTNAFAVDMTGWRLDGAVDFTFRSGTVIPAFDPGAAAANRLYVSPNSVAFRARTNGPSGGQGRFVQGPYKGYLSSSGGAVLLLNARGEEVGRAVFPGDAGVEQRRLVLSELMYHARPPEGDEVGAGFSAPDFDFVEIHNTGHLALSLAGLRFTEGIAFDFAGGAIQTIGAGEHVVVVRNLAAFTHRYPGAAARVAGEYTGELDDGGERVTLFNAVLDEAISFRYDDARGWPFTADGAGHSLVPLTWDGQADDVLDYGGNWRASAYRGGSPGAADPDPVTDVVLNEVAAHTDAAPPQESNDWLELFNAGASNVSLSGWFLSDDPQDLTKWSLPPANTLAPGGRIVFDEITGFHPSPDVGFGLDKDGEQVLLSHLPGNGGDRVADAVRFKGQENGVTEGRYPDGQAWHFRLAPTRGGPNRLLDARAVLDEVMYHPPPTATHPEDNRHDEYIVVRNVSPAPLGVTEGAGTWRVAGDVAFSFPSGVVLVPDERILLVSFAPTNAPEVAAFEDLHGVPRGALRLLGPYAGNLSNRGGRITLEKPQAGDLPGDPVSWIVIDECIYFDRAPWPRTADATGLSLHRLDPGRAGNDAGNWRPARPSPAQDLVVFPPMNLSIRRVAGGVSLRWDALRGVDYGLEASDALSPADWREVAATNTTDTTAFHEEALPTNTIRRLYRVRTVY